MRAHAFVAMPFGTKPGPDGQPIDFDRVYAELIKPALQEAGCTSFRADEELRAGDIRTDMFQELLIADLVVVDLTLDNPNVWYELGVRHALRARGVVLLQGPRPTSPFDLYTDRKLGYRLLDGRPHPDSVKQGIQALADMVRATLATPTRRKVSPVYQLLPNLEQPQWRRLLLKEANEFSDLQEAWSLRMETARRRNLPGDILVLAHETPTRALMLESQRHAGNSLLKLKHYDFALEQFEAALAIDPDDQECRQKRGVCLGRLGRHDEAHPWVMQLTDDYPDDPETWALAGRVAKDEWIQRWCRAESSEAQMRSDAAEEESLLAEAVQPYRHAFVLDPSHYYSGINALTLLLLRRHLGGEVSQEQIESLAGGVRWACLSALEREKRLGDKDYWARASQAELGVLLGPADQVKREYRAAFAAADRDWFALDSSRQTLMLLRQMGYRPETTELALELLDRELALSTPPAAPRQVFLFSGHMVDAPGRATPRFPAEKAEAAAQRITAALAAMDAGPDDLALSQAAAGGDLLFLEACQQLGVPTQVLLPFAEPEFIDKSVRPSSNGEDWCMRYYGVQAQLQQPLREMPDELGPCPPGVDPYERCNAWLLNTALSWGVNKVRFLCLWNGGGGDGPGGTAHMYNEVKRRTGRVTWIDVRHL